MSGSNNDFSTLELETAPLTLERILRKSQRSLKAALSDELKALGYGNVDTSAGYLYAVGELPVLLVAHLDTVHKESVKTICQSKDGQILMSPEGIGGDDRAGVYMILQIIRIHRCHVLFCEDEETGGNGARAFAASGHHPAVNYIVELDRRGSNDAVFYRCSNDEFKDFVCSFGFEEASGSFSDISVIAPRLGVAAVNLSAGYFNEHRLHESIDLGAVEQNIMRVLQMVETSTGCFEYVERRYTDQLYEDMTLWGFMGEGRPTAKHLMPLPEGTVLKIGGEAVAGGAGYMIDYKGRVYNYIPELDAATPSENITVCTRGGKKVSYQHGKAHTISIMPLDEVLEMMDVI